ncbi:MAG: aryl-sulfate sulfotransferase [Bacteroidota bacterium]
MKKYTYLVLAALIGLSLLSGCGDDDPNPPANIITSLQLIENPNGVAPLTARLLVSTNTPAKVSIKVFGQNGDASDIVHDFPEVSNSFDIPVLGLYPDSENQVQVTFSDQSGAILTTTSFTVLTDPLIAEMPQIEVNTLITGTTVPGLNFVNYFGHNGNVLPQRAFMFDQFGDIRWYLDFSSHPTLSTLFFDNGMNFLQNGNLVFGDGTTDKLYEINMLGEVLNEWEMPGYGFHHHVIEKPNGNFLVTVNDNSKTTVEDVVIEIGRTSGNIVNVWDLNESLDNSRRTWDTDLADLDIDWFHANAVEYSPDDDAIIVSGRTQGTVKLSNDNEVIWILAPHKGWATAGNGSDLNQFLLQPLDAQGNTIDDQQIVEGETNHPGFEWAWYQHSPVLMPNGNIMIFDNGDNRNYISPGNYSRAVEYEIDEQNMTIKQIASYGKERGQETYSRIVSKVTYHESQNNVIFTPGAITDGSSFSGKIVEVDWQNQQVVFEATISPPEPLFIITFHNVLRANLYR